MSKYIRRQVVNCKCQFFFLLYLQLKKYVYISETFQSLGLYKHVNYVPNKSFPSNFYFLVCPAVVGGYCSTRVERVLAAMTLFQVNPLVCPSPIVRLSRKNFPGCYHGHRRQIVQSVSIGKTVGLVRANISIINNCFASNSRQSIVIERPHLSYCSITKM